MKKLIALLLLSNAFQVSFCQSDQTVAAENMGGGTFAMYTADLVDGEYVYGFSTFKAYLKVEPYFEHECKEITYSIPESNTEEMYVPSEYGHVITYVKANYSGNEEMVKKYHALDLKESQRIVFLEDYVYILTNWKNHENYQISRILKKGDLKGLAVAKETFAAPKKMKEVCHEEKLKTYFMESVAKHKEVYPKWIAENPGAEGKREWAIKTVEMEIKALNDAYWKTEEGQRILENQRNYEAAKSGGNTASNFKILNNTNDDIYVITELGTSSRISKGSSGSFKCNTKMYRCYLNGTSWNKKGEFIGGGSNSDCGKTISIN